MSRSRQSFLAVIHLKDPRVWRKQGLFTVSDACCHCLLSFRTSAFTQQEHHSMETHSGTKDTRSQAGTAPV